MIDWEPARIRSAVSGTWLTAPRETPIAGVRTDTRTLATHDPSARERPMFVALVGERHDAHAYLGQAITGGAGVALGHDEHAIGGDLRTLATERGVGILRVGDTKRALGRLASAYRRSLEGTRVVGITGSNGKTTTVRLTEAVLRSRLRGTASVKSFNNDVGVPLTILGARATDQFLICEIGMNARGEIAPLADMAEPDVGVITSLGRAHIEALGSEQAIADEKASLLRFIRAGGLAIVPADTDRLASHLRPLEHVVRVGMATDADVRVSDVEQSIDGVRFRLNDRADFACPLIGRHNALNAAIAVTVGRRFGLNDKVITEGLSRVEAPAMRLRHETTPHGVELFDDAYNASPESVRAALETFTELTPERCRVVVLGDMMELGDHAEALHDEVGRLLAQSPPDLLVTVGRLAERFAAGVAASASVRVLDDVAIAHVRSLIKPRDAVLVKGSRAVGLDRLVEAVRAPEDVRTPAREGRR